MEDLSMRIGVVFPQTEFGNDPLAIKDYAQATEALGYNHILAYDHVLGADPNRPEGWQGPYTYLHPFHEPFVLFSFMSAVTSRLGFLTGILILPQRQTALVAKQAAALDVLSKGRLRLGVGIGWNAVEYTALGENFQNRGKRIEEQIQVLNRLWTEPLVTFTGRWHTIPAAGLNPMPLQQPIPLWFGGHADVVLERAARLGNGWLPGFRTAADAAPALEKLRRYLELQGRSMETFGLEPRLPYGNGDFHQLGKQADEWKNAGANYLAINTMGCGFTTPKEHLRALRKFSEQVGIAR
jgi:probable F420-dependent oxidoreductase